MTIAQTLHPPLARRRFVLATDLDGTFLGGTEADRRRLYDWIERNRESVGLIFVTGRDPEFIMEMCAERGLPWPEYVVGDVGTTIAEVVSRRTIAPIPALEADIAQRWGDRGNAVRAALHDHPGLTLQPTAFRHRVSYDMDPESYCPSAEEKIAQLGLDWLISDNRFFDVLPRGVSKGPSVKRLIAHLGIPETRVLVAGDTLNDLSMLACGLNAVAVGNSEAALLERVGDLDHLHVAQAHGAGGILEAIAAFALHDTPQGD
ncbi:HAD family hydrolase [Phaeovulum vinaykumarii]|uniref:Hydroxymethylpyrimidine pyrophosphatase n=1 Tax=Phaeovulum vinaykumarii TaxID=407234 RepID=A0A1N7LMT4_9RHOB|nr:HAD family hydrolase [Phaeovulum vinaykumarii]SIS75165.1 Hydroxymethylpyrimidine pyrophosphatase [Phaeovulum vinaykumarii]SOC05577.1 hydroxymethylpyrimidine pyrophosphatase-like HAD family hydrolase [Phaeovulum vinaykumarii]